MLFYKELVQAVLPAPFTLKNGIENMLKNMMGDKVAQVIAING